MTDEERIEFIKEADAETLLRLWRLEPSGSPWFTDKVGDEFTSTMGAMRKSDPAAWVAASKKIGWD